MASLVKYYCLVAVCLFNHFDSAEALPTSPFLCYFASLEDCIRSYWSLGYKYTSIVTFLATFHGILISLRQLKYLINVKYNLRRRRSQSTAHEIRRAVRVSWKTRNPEFRRNSAGIFKSLFFVHSKQFKSSRRLSEVRIFSQDDPRATEVARKSTTNNRTAEDVPKIYRRFSLVRVPVIRKSRANHAQTLREKQKYQRINKFKMNEIRRNTPQ